MSRPPDRGAPLVLFDLDGTLVDSEPGITASLRYATAAVGAPDPTADQLRELIGPPFPRAFVEVLGLDPARADAMMAAYREVYGRTGVYDVTVYPGVVDVLAGLGGAALTTSKPEVYAREVVRHVGLDAHLGGGVFGATLDGAVEGKAAVVGLALAAHPGRRVSALVGDRHHDVEGAHVHGLTAIGVTWGFGDRTELAAAEHLVDSPAELAALLAALG